MKQSTGYVRAVYSIAEMESVTPVSILRTSWHSDHKRPAMDSMDTFTESDDSAICLLNENTNTEASDYPLSEDSAPAPGRWLYPVLIQSFR